MFSGVLTISEPINKLYVEYSTNKNACLPTTFGKAEFSILFCRNDHSIKSMVQCFSFEVMCRVLCENSYHGFKKNNTFQSFNPISVFA